MVRGADPSPRSPLPKEGRGWGVVGPGSGREGRRPTTTEDGDGASGVSGSVPGLNPGDWGGRRREVGPRQESECVGGVPEGVEGVGWGFHSTVSPYFGPLFGLGCRGGFWGLRGPTGRVPLPRREGSRLGPRRSSGYVDGQVGQGARRKREGPKTYPWQRVTKDSGRWTTRGGL